MGGEASNREASVTVTFNYISRHLLPKKPKAAYDKSYLKDQVGYFGPLINCSRLTAKNVWATCCGMGSTGGMRWELGGRYPNVLWR